MTLRFFVTAVGTEHGKTYLTRALSLAARAGGSRVAALKPIETGVDPTPHDAVALAAASGAPDLANLAHFYRAKPPLAPAAIARRGGPAVPATETLVNAINGVGAEVVFIEGAGGVRVPIDQHREVRDLIAAIGAPAILVAHDALGVLSYTLTAFESLSHANIDVAAVVLTEHGEGDPSRDDNALLLAERLPCPVLRFPACPDDDDATLAAAAADIWRHLRSK